MEVKLADFSWNKEEQYWWISIKSGDFDLIVPGNPQAPDSTAVVLANEVLEQGNELYQRANTYLDGFIDRQKVLNDSEGEIISLQCGFHPNRVKIAINYTADIYGLWFVTLQKTKQAGWWGVEFGRTTL